MEKKGAFAVFLIAFSLCGANFAFALGNCPDSYNGAKWKDCTVGDGYTSTGGKCEKVNTVGLPHYGSCPAPCSCIPRWTYANADMGWGNGDWGYCCEKITGGGGGAQKTCYPKMSCSQASAVPGIFKSLADESAECIEKGFSGIVTQSYSTPITISSSDLCPSGYAESRDLIYGDGVVAGAEVGDCCGLRMPQEAYPLCPSQCIAYCYSLNYPEVWDTLDLDEVLASVFVASNIDFYNEVSVVLPWFYGNAPDITAAATLPFADNAIREECAELCMTTGCELDIELPLEPTVPGLAQYLPAEPNLPGDIYKLLGMPAETNQPGSLLPVLTGKSIVADANWNLTPISNYIDTRTKFLSQQSVNAVAGLRKYSNAQPFLLKLAFYEYALRKNAEIEDMKQFLDYFFVTIKRNLDDSNSLDAFYLNLLDREQAFFENINPEDNEKIQLMLRYRLLVLIETDLNIENRNFARQSIYKDIVCDNTCHITDFAESCDYDCYVRGISRCSGEFDFQMCGYFDEDYCLDWGEQVECPAGTKCETGQCVIEE